MPPFDFDFGTDRDSFSAQFGSDLQYVKNTNQEDVKDTSQEDDKDSGGGDTPTKNKKNVDVAGIINASALGLNSITNAFTAFSGKGAAQQGNEFTAQQREEDSPKKKAPSTVLVIVIIVVVMLFIGALAFAKRKGATPTTTP